MEPSDDRTEEILRVAVSDLDYLRATAEQYQVQVTELKSAGIEPVSTIAVVLLGSVWAVNTVSRLVDERKGGQVIDMRPGANLAVYRSRDVQYGLIRGAGSRWHGDRARQGLAGQSRRRR